MIVTVLKFDQVKNWPWLVVVDHGWVVVNMKNFTQTCRYAYQSVAFLLNINSVSFEHGWTWSTMVEKWFRPKTFAKHTYTHIVRKLIKFEVELIVCNNPTTLCQVILSFQNLVSLLKYAILRLFMLWAPTIV